MTSAAATTSTLNVARVGLGLTGAVCAVSSAALFIIIAEPIPSVVIAAGRVLVTGVALAVLAPASLWNALVALASDRSVRIRVAGASVLLAGHFAAWIASLALTSVLRSVALVAMQPLFAALLGRFIGDRAPWQLYLGAVVALAGTVVLMLPTAHQGQGAVQGDLLALLGGAAAAGYLILGRDVRGRIPLPGYLGVVHLAAAVWLAPFAVAAIDRTAGVTGVDILAVLYLGVVPGVVGHGLLNWSARLVPVHIVSMAILLEPAGATALTAFVLGRPVTAAELVGAAIVLVGVGVAGLSVRDGR